MWPRRATRAAPGLHSSSAKPPPFGQHPWYLIRDNDGKYGAAFAAVAAASGIIIRSTLVRALRFNAVRERFIGSVRHSCLDHLLVLSERHLAYVLREYVAYYDRARPHQGLGQALPEPSADEPGIAPDRSGAVPGLGGLHQAYHRTA
jgi:putative transposase